MCFNDGMASFSNFGDSLELVRSKSSSIYKIIDMTNPYTTKQQTTTPFLHRNDLSNRMQLKIVLYSKRPGQLKCTIGLATVCCMVHERNICRDFFWSCSSNLVRNNIYSTVQTLQCVMTVQKKLLFIEHVTVSFSDSSVVHIMLNA